MKTIAQQLNVTDFPFVIYDKDGNEIYYENSSGFWCKGERDAHGNSIYHEDSDGYWFKRERDVNGNEIYHETSDGYWIKREYDAHGNLIRYETSYGYWRKSEYDAQGKEIYFENSNGKIIDKRPKQVELTLQQIADKFGINIKQLDIKDCLILTTLKLI